MQIHLAVLEMEMKPVAFLLIVVTTVLPGSAATLFVTDSGPFGAKTLSIEMQMNNTNKSFFFDTGAQLTMLTNDDLTSQLPTIGSVESLGVLGTAVPTLRSLPTKHKLLTSIILKKAIFRN
ncbi:MAG: hypothetical protein C5B49_15210 [Bdellovibrio sp.]|nr:MAG: hypothetical protein C5B49_15210 [Bdellovibrio sp.]